MRRKYNYGLAYPHDYMIPDYGKWNIYRTVTKTKLSQAAQLKLEWIIFYQTVGKRKVVPTAKHFGISAKTLHKWLKRFDQRNLLSLEEQSRTPNHVRAWMVTKTQEEEIKTLRQNNMKLGKKKLQVLYQQKYKQSISTWKIERVVRKHHLYPNVIEQQKKIAKTKERRQKIRIHQIKDTIKQVNQFGIVWHVDSIVLWWYGTRKIIFTALEQHTRIAYARVYKTNTAGFAEDFLKRLNYLTSGKIHIMHSDNGSEFQGAFSKACKTLGIIQAYSRAYTPKDNALLERFNRTLQEEWLALSKQGLEDIDQANISLTEWLISYNTYCPHQALDYKTPFQYAQDTFFKVLPMWSASTIH